MLVPVVAAGPSELTGDRQAFPGVAGREGAYLPADPRPRADRADARLHVTAAKVLRAQADWQVRPVPELDMELRRLTEYSAGLSEDSKVKVA